MPARVLVIDDDMQLAQMEKAALEDAGYLVDIGFDGQAAIQLARTRRPDLIVMDVNMPMTNGVKALEFLRSNQDTRSVPIIFVTSADSRFVYAAVEKHQRVAYLKKPIDVDHLLEMARDFIARYPISR